MDGKVKWLAATRIYKYMFFILYFYNKIHNIKIYICIILHAIFNIYFGILLLLYIQKNINVALKRKKQMCTKYI